MKNPVALSSASQPRTPLVYRSTWALLVGVWSVVGLFALRGQTWLAGSVNATIATCVFVGLMATIMVACYGVVHEADHLAEELGEPYGTLVLTLSVVAIEVILIASVLLGPGDTPTIARDSIFSVLMIVLNLAIGVCLMAGAARNGDQAYNAQGGTAYLSMIVVLAGAALVVPNHTSGQGGFTLEQAVVVGTLTGVLYFTFLRKQTGTHRRLFLQPRAGMWTVPAVEPLDDDGEQPAPPRQADRTVIVVRSLVLLGMILPIVLLAHHLAVVVDYGIAATGMPVTIGGVLIAIIVFTPECITAVRAAMRNQMQRAMNLCLGSSLSTVGLTVPAVLLIGALTGQQMVMGISQAETVLFGLTLVLGTLTFSGKRTTSVQGMMHFALFLVFVLLLFRP